MNYNKLVRDNIPQIIRNEGRVPIARQADFEEFNEKLKEKLLEEVNEYINEPGAEELADILEVIHKLSEIYNMNKDELEGLRKKKAQERGGFENKIILDKINSKE